MRFIDEMERIIKNNGAKGLDIVEHYYGAQLEIYRQQKDDVFSRVHGHNAGKDGIKVASIIGVLISDDFFATSDGYSGGFQLGFLFTRSTELKTGDTIKVVSSDSKVRRYRVESKAGVGITTEVFVKWKISAIGD